ncbi:hypothetical protein BOX15_Mlig021303g1 [Macrostomum lignano]|uniref:Bestrophin homolog n=1 Tax=Macrostomum lignano TaxID=282301 RepID=A0A267GLP8_9PLAT|nr:hypothetical protein BOX15_Mlig021303g1 [Macrostomum lignano]
MTYSYSYRVGSVKLLGLARLLGIWRASVYKLVFRELLIFCVLYTATSCVYRLLLQSPVQKKIFEKIVVYSGTFESILPLTFILGFYVTVVVQRWWAQYCYIPWPDRIMSYFAVLIPGNDEAPVLLRRTAIRYLIQAEVLLLRTISSTVKKRFPTLQSLVDQGLMTENEFKLYNDEKVPHISSKYWVPTQWCAMLFHKAHSEKRITDFRLCVLLDELSKFKECLGTLFSYDWISIPLVYTQVATLAVYVFYFNSIVSRQYVNFASVREEFGPEISAKYSIDLYVPIDTLMQLFFYLGWLKVAEQMINPFGEDDDDFECNWIVDRNLKVGLFAVDNMLSMLPELEKDRWWKEEDPQMSYTQASEKFAMTGGWFGSTANLEVAPQNYGSSHGHLPNIPEDASESNFTSTHTLHSRGGGDQDVSPKKKKKRLPPLRIIPAVDRVDEVKTFFTSKSVKRRRSRTTATESQPSSPDISRSMPDTHFCFANNISANSYGRGGSGSGGGRQQRSREESGEARLAQLAEATQPESASTSGVGIDQSSSCRALLGNGVDDEEAALQSGADLTKEPLLPANAREDGGICRRRRCRRRRESDDVDEEDEGDKDDGVDDEEDDEAGRESSAGSAIVLVDGGDVSGVVPDDAKDAGVLGEVVGLVVETDSGFTGDATDPAAAASTAATGAAATAILAVSDASPVKAASTSGAEHRREDSAASAGAAVGAADTPPTSAASACHMYVDDWISEHKEDFVSDSNLKGTYSASACQLHNLHVEDEASGTAGSGSGGIIGGCRQSAGDLPAIVEMQGGDPMEMMLEASVGSGGASGGGGGGGDNLEKRVAFNPEIEKLEYNANYPVDQTLPAETTEPELPHHCSQQQQQQTREQQSSEGEESADLEEESAASSSYYE